MSYFLLRINIEWTRESGRYKENRPRDDGSQPRIRVVDRHSRHTTAPRERDPIPPSHSEYRTHTLDAAPSSTRRRGSRSRSPMRRGGSVGAEYKREGQAAADWAEPIDRERRRSPKRITLRRDRDVDRGRDIDRDRDRDRSTSRDRERERERDRGEWKRRDSIERDVRDTRGDRESRDGREGGRNGYDRRDGSRERERGRDRDRDDRAVYRDDRDRDRVYDRDRGYERDRPSRDIVRRGSYDRESDHRVRSRSPAKGRMNGSGDYKHNGRSRSRSARPLTPNRSRTPPRSLRRSRSRSLSPVNGRNGSISKLRRSVSPVRRRSRS